MNVLGRSVSKRELERRVGNLQQIGGTRHFEYSTGRGKGVQAVEVNTGSGLVFTVLPGRGLDIVNCTFRGTNLVYLTPNGISHPAFYNPKGLEWLNTFLLDEGDYVTGIEPVNTKIVGRGTLKKEDRLPWIEAGETRDMEVEIGVLEGIPEIEDFSARIRKVLEDEQTSDPI